MEDTKSTHKVEIVPIHLEKHGNADKLSIIRVFGYTVVVATEHWKDKEGTLGAYVPPDSLVDPTRKEFEFLANDARVDGWVRIKAKKLRGIVSFGLLVPAPEGSKEGDNVASILNVRHYEPPLKGVGGSRGISFGGENEKDPGIFAPKYDVDAFRRYAQKVFRDKEPVWLTEKIHGANARYCFYNNQMYYGSRTGWKKEFPSYEHLTVDNLFKQIIDSHESKKHLPNYTPITEDQAKDKAQALIQDILSKPKQRNLWWKALDKHSQVIEFCKKNPGWVLYGEVYGCVQDLNYGHKPGEVSFAAFDILKTDQTWINAEELYEVFKDNEIPHVPVFGKKEYDFDLLCELAEGKSTIPGANHVREGIVIKPLIERWDEKIGRVNLKIVGSGYLEKSKDDTSISEGD